MNVYERTQRRLKTVFDLFDNIYVSFSGGKDSGVLLEPDMHLSVREADGQVMRPAAAMSCGTADQMYLALRLAMCRRLLPPDAPMVLDDALVNFDPARTRAALRVLREEPRQILLFTCQEREGNYLEGRPGVTRTALRGGGA